MREFKKRRSTRGELLNFCYRLAGTLVLLLITFIAVRGAFDMYRRLGLATAGQQEAESRLAALKTEQTEVVASVGQLSSSRGVEALMREHYGVVKPGEGVIQIVQNTSASSTSDGKSDGWFGQVLRALFSW